MKLLSLISSRKNLWLFSIIFIEGYVVLACELLAIRLLVPFVGSGTETVSIVISAVLLPLAIGYHRGSSAFKRARSRGVKTLRNVLVKNLTMALIILCFGLSYFFLELFFALFGQAHALVKTAIYSAIFLVYPVYLMAQTIPIISHYFSRSSLSEATGAMLFFSTMGSFLGSVFSTLVLMMVIGVHNTVLVTLFLVVLAIVIIRQRVMTFDVFFAGGFWLVALAMNQNALFVDQHVYSNNAYSIVSVTEEKPGVRVMSVNRSASSSIGGTPADRFGYIAYLEDSLIYSYKDKEPLKILVIGAGGFTLGHYDEKNIYTFIDIDPALKEISEKYLLKKPLGGQKRFVAASARAFLAQSDEVYDLIVVDAYSNVMTIPAECITQEFFAEVKKQLAPGGVVAANIVSSGAYADKFSVRIYNTFASVFPQFNKQVINNFSPWNKKAVSNNLYIYVNSDKVGDKEIYTDDLNTYSLDKF